MFKHPSYASKCKALCSDPASQLIRGLVIEALGYPNLMLMKGPTLQEKQNPDYYVVRTLKAGKRK
jgi:hypothetical protein